jgi:hypothetical protein
MDGRYFICVTAYILNLLQVRLFLQRKKISLRRRVGRCTLLRAMARLQDLRNVRRERRSTEVGKRRRSGGAATRARHRPPPHVHSPATPPLHYRYPTCIVGLPFKSSILNPNFFFLGGNRF